MANDVDIQKHIKGLIEEEHGLRSSLGTGGISASDGHRRLAALEVELDQCWDLLRQRRAKREFGADPADAAVRPVQVVEGYTG